MPTRTEAIKKFLMASTHSDLAGMYSANMEVQVNVAQDGGQRVSGEYKGRQWVAWSDGIQTWKPFRIPLNAATKPEYTDTEMNYDLAEHAEGIGMTGWDWKNKVSRWVAFDFDAIVGHKGSKRLDARDLQNVIDAASSLDWVTIRRSTSGSGLHLYVYLDGVPTENHTHHAALARAILGQMAALTSFDFEIKVDNCGGNMWVWHRKMKGTNGLQLLKKGEILKSIPANWQDHLKVVSGKRQRTVPSFVKKNNQETLEQIDFSNLPENETEDEKQFAELMGKATRVPLDSDHKKLFAWLTENNCLWWWDQDHHMLVTHTHHLKLAHSALSFKGPYDTISKGTEAPNDHNVYGFPMKNGAWTLRRYTPGVQEADTWSQDRGGWTQCFYNRDPDLKTASRTHGGIEHPTGGFVFTEAEQAVKAAGDLGALFALPNKLLGRKARLKEHKDGRLIVEVEKEDRDGDVDGWLPDKGLWKRIFNTKTPVSAIDVDVDNFDDTIRHLVDTAGNDQGWAIYSEGSWKLEPINHVYTTLAACGVSSKDSKIILGNSVLKCWTLVNYPFQPEYPGNRLWNREAAKFRYTPVSHDNLYHPTWDKILSHCGSGLDQAVKENAWCQANGISVGGDYLRCWIASIFQFPLEPLPYLFLYGPQNSGKSIFHEALSLLLTSGLCRADTALVSESGFNAELANSVICVIEETDLKRNRQAYNRIKDWCTSRQINIHEKKKTPRLIPNSTHWIQCANEISAVPIFPGDTRITMIYVGDLDPMELIPKKQLIGLLEKEAADFLTAMLRIELPPSNDRLNVPVIVTDEKLHAQKANQSALELFIEEECFRVDGEMILYSDFYDRFREWLDPNDVSEWSQIRVGRELPGDTPKGRNPRDASRFYVVNLTFKEPAKNEKGEYLPSGKARLTVKNDKIIFREEG